MFGCASNLTINSGGIPFLRSESVTVGTDAVDFGFGFDFRRQSPVGIIAVNLADAIPTGTTGTLPVRFTLNGRTQALTTYGGEAVTAADITGTGVYLVFYNRYTNALQLIGA